MHSNTFKLVDCGCYMLETNTARWVIQDPFNGYMPLTSKLWDVFVEHPDEPNNRPLKFLGSCKTKRAAINLVAETQALFFGYDNVKAVSNEFYNEDYTLK